MFDDGEIQFLAIEAIGLLGLIEKDLFFNYQQVFTAILEESLPVIEEGGLITKPALHESIIAIKSIFDGLIVHGIWDISQELIDIITTRLIYAPNRIIR